MTTSFPWETELAKDVDPPEEVVESLTADDRDLADPTSRVDLDPSSDHDPDAFAEEEVRVDLAREAAEVAKALRDEESFPTVSVADDVAQDDEIRRELDDRTPILSRAAIDLRAVDALLDDLSDPRRLIETAGSMKATVLDAVRRRSDARREDRDGDVKSSTDLRRELVGVANDADVLDALSKAFGAGTTEAKAIAGELLDELPQRGGKPRRSAKVGDGNGFELSVTVSAASKLDVKVDEVVDVLVAHLIGDAERRHEEAKGDKSTSPLDLTRPPVTIYADALRVGIVAFRDLLAASPGFKSTALDALATELENADEDRLAKRLRKAYGKKETGSPSVKLDRKPLAGDEDEETAK